MNQCDAHIPEYLLHNAINKGKLLADDINTWRSYSPANTELLMEGVKELFEKEELLTENLVMFIITASRGRNLFHGISLLEGPYCHRVYKAILGYIDLLEFFAGRFSIARAQMPVIPTDDYPLYDEWLCKAVTRYEDLLFAHDEENYISPFTKEETTAMHGNLKAGFGTSLQIQQLQIEHYIRECSLCREIFPLTKYLLFPYF